MSDPLLVSEIFSSIQGEGLLTGRRQLFIRLAGCNLGCRYCDTVIEAGEGCLVETAPGSGILELLPRPITLDTVLGIAADWTGRLPGAHHSFSITGGEPLLQAALLSEWLPALRHTLPIHLETNGTLPEALAQVVDLVDYISMDIKLPSTAGCVEDLWEAHRGFLRVAAGHNASVKIVVAEETPLEEIDRVCGIILEVAPATPLFIQPLSGGDKGSAVSAARLLACQAAAAARLADVRVIPQMHLMLGAL
jgi:organic radical activating enzyme